MFFQDYRSEFKAPDYRRAKLFPLIQIDKQLSIRSTSYVTRDSEMKILTRDRDISVGFASRMNSDIFMTIGGRKFSQSLIFNALPMIYFNLNRLDSQPSDEREFFHQTTGKKCLERNFQSHRNVMQNNFSIERNLLFRMNRSQPATA